MQRLLLCVLPLVAGCSMEQMLEDMVPDEHERFARAHLQLFFDGDIEGVLDELHPAIAAGTSAADIETVLAYLPDAEPVGNKLIGYNRNTTGDVVEYQVSFEYEYEESWLLASVATRTEGDGATRVTAANFQATEQPIEELNALRPLRHGITGLLFMGLVFAVPVFIIVTFIVCLRTPVPKRRWLWCIGILLGVGQITMNFTTGQVQVNTAAVQVLGAAFFRPGLYGPWLFTVAVPLVAAIFWYRRRDWLRDAAAKREEPDADEPPVE